MKKSLRKPERWQDFEDLCKKLFGEIWQCPYTIKKNGRQGQPQFGIDVYAIPKGEDSYFGVQCKGKDEYSHAQLSITEIDNEVQKAKLFKPTLKVIIFATTANKDAGIEEYVRLKDLENRQSGSFQILLYCWEDLVDLIEEHRDIFNWYVNEQQYRETFKMEVSFENGTDGLSLEPPFIKKVTTYRVKVELPIQSNFESVLKSMQRYNTYAGIYPTATHSILGEPLNKNLSWCSFYICMKNIGTKVIEDWKLYLLVENGKYRMLDDDSDKSIFANIHGTNNNRNYWLHEKEGYFFYKSNSPLIQQDAKSFKIAILPFHDCQSIKLAWKLLARDYNDSGTLTLTVNPKYEIERHLIEVESKELIQPSRTEILEKIVPK